MASATPSSSLRSPSLTAEAERWPLEARFPEASHNGDVSEIKKIAKELDVKGNGIRKTVASTTYMGMNAASGRLPIYRYLVEVVKMDVDTPDTARGKQRLDDLLPCQVRANHRA
ncbi:hypothetical protein ZWY2020_024680 [Hordeum vulgare]|nr:hypothetical protein ZWY2020_024680 [Hordeum vulgare]